MKFDQGKKLHRLALEISEMSNGYDNDSNLFEQVKLMLDAGQRLAVIGQNGIGKTTFLKTLMGEVPLRSGEFKWSENAKIAYFAQDHKDQFSHNELLIDWMMQWRQEGDDEQVIRGILGRMLFSGDAIKKPVSVLSGGEKVRMLLGKFILQKPNVMVLDEPTNHLDMESIESLNMALEEFPGTIIFVSHDRQLVSSLATQVLELKPGGKAKYYQGKYEDYLELVEPV
jgi:ATPase subunit of ABC transporter with duplicated ATPase domains